MPSKNRIKQYVAGDYYHVYNRGVEKRLIFLDQQDYKVFLGYLKLYLSPSHPLSKPHRDLSKCIELAAYCLMPNHFHLLVRQLTVRGMEELMRSVMVAYVRYFNTKYNRVGALFQGAYKAVRITSDQQLYQIEHYIYNNPKDMVTDVRTYAYSSLGRRLDPPIWLRPPDLEGQFSYSGLTLLPGRT